MRAIRFVILCLASLSTVLLGATALGQALSSIDRTIAKLPQLNEPLFALAVLGAQQETRMWLVLDKSSPGATDYDVLFADLDGNGDLTAADERVTVRAAEGRFTIPLLVDPNSGAEHTDFSLRLSGGLKPKHMLSLRWRGQHKLGGGYPVDPDDGYMRFADSPEAAPVVWFNGDGPMRFQPWYDTELAIGGETTVKVFLGQEGVGASTFCAFQEYVLADGELVNATLIYTDTQGKQREATSHLDLRC